MIRRVPPEAVGVSGGTPVRSIPGTVPAYAERSTVESGSADGPVPAGTARTQATEARHEGLSISFTATRDERYVRRLLGDRFWTTAWLGRLFTAAALLVGVDGLLAGSRAAPAGLFCLAMAGLALVYPAFPWRWTLRRMPPHYFMPCEFVLSSETLTVSSTLVTTRVSWAAIASASERPFAFVLSEHGGNYRDIPRAALTGEQDAELRQFLIDRRLLRPPGGLPVPGEQADAG